MRCSGPTTSLRRCVFVPVQFGMPSMRPDEGGGSWDLRILTVSEYEYEYIAGSGQYSYRI
eukprot:scaffold200226_cov32-Prasinocladus_malaysianus.AAC.1